MKSLGWAGRRRRRAAAVASALLLTVSLTAACSSSSSHSRPPVILPSSAPASGIRGAQLSQPVALSAADAAATFTSTSGSATTLSALQGGGLMLLYFGYTNCPDVCPTTMYDLGAALKTVPSVVQAHTQVVFVTSDPARDTPAVMRIWLSNFDGGLVKPFVGLTASIAQIDRVATSLGVPLSPPQREPNGTINVQHGAQTLAFMAGKATVEWLAGTSVADYAHDINLLAAKAS